MESGVFVWEALTKKVIGDVWRKLGIDWVKAKEKALKLGLFYGGGEGSRTPVRKHVHRVFSERSRSFTFPPLSYERQYPSFGSFIKSGPPQSLSGLVPLIFDAADPL